MIWVSSSTADWRCPITSQQFAEAATINYNNFVRPSGARRWCHKDVNPGFHRQSPGLVMLCFMASPTNWFAACSQFRTPSPGWLRALGGLIISHQSCAPPAALTSGAAARRVQGRDACLPVLVRPCSGLPGRRLSTRHRRTFQTNAFYWHSNACCQPDVQQFRRQDLRSCWNPECGTVCRQTWDNRDCHAASSGGHWRHFYLDSETKAQCKLF